MLPATKVERKMLGTQEKSTKESCIVWHLNLATILGLNSQSVNPAGAWHLKNTHWRLESRQVPDTRTKKDEEDDILAE